jgi:hypothetical protein
MKLNISPVKLQIDFQDFESFALIARCLKSMHLLEPLELSILARAFDIHKSMPRTTLYTAEAAE